MIDFWKDVKNFKAEEFDDPTLPGSGSNMSPEFIHLLDQIRNEIGPMKINSGFRTVIHNISVGGKPDSAHLKGVAADIACPDSHIRFALTRAAIKFGFKRIGIGSDFIHLDLSFDLPQEVEWLYPQGVQG